MNLRMNTILLLCCLTLSCKTTEDSRNSPRKGLLGQVDCFHIVNGQKTSDFPEVTLIVNLDSAGDIRGICTGTFIGSRTVLTAAHCIMSNAIGITRATELAPTVTSQSAALSTYVPVAKVLNMDPSAATRNSWRPEYAKNDIAILIFSSTVAPAIAPLLERKGIPTEDVTLVGFGQDNVDAKKSDPVISKRFGYNTLGVVPMGLSLVGPPQSVGSQLAKNATTASGDSGGPLLVGGKVAGVLSGGGPFSPTLDQSFYADITTNEIRAFIQSAVQQGGDIGPGNGVGLANANNPIQNSDCLH